MKAENMNEPKMAEKEKPVADTNYIQNLAVELKQTLWSKNQDYAPGDEFSNFELAAEFAGVETIDVMLVQIGIKLTRIQNLFRSLTAPNNESLRDSLVDLAGYSVIAAAWLDMVQADAAKDKDEH